LVPLIFRIGFFFCFVGTAALVPSSSDGWIYYIFTGQYSIIPPLLEIVARPAALFFVLAAQH
jgi:hypothetical protein